ncbi:Uncharacterized protein M6B38_111135 [Iris pallida]|uniref:Uncharacterized protein n=1 Tax=Iris pallida TaxID=29817 RepID=A0AAX6DN57_IRIPA|nr:Uncharacterized protein M6B38_111135 [Iris pallida]
MGTEVLRSNDCLKNTLHLNFYGSRPPPSPPPPMNSSRKKHLRSPPPEPSRKKQFRSGLPRPRSVHRPEPETRKALVMEEVKILKRGEPAKPAAAADNVDRVEQSRSVRRNPDKENSKPKTSGSVSAKASAGSLRYDTATALCSTNRIGPNPEIVPRFSDLNLNIVYAGTSMITSPSPSSLPIPKLSLTARPRPPPPSCTVGTSLNIAATKEIMCLLRMDA